MKQLAMRCCMLAVGIVVMAAGIVVVTESKTGTSPISSTGFVLSCAFPSVSYGMFMFAWNMLLLLGQIIILRRRFKLTALLQIPISVLFSLSVDFFTWLLSSFTPANYAISFLVLALGICLLAFGVALTVIANIAMNCAEALVAAITLKTGWNFGYTKVGFDVMCVVIATTTSLITLQGIVGIREGTLVAACTTGFIVNAIVKALGGVKPAIDIKK